MQDDHVRAGDRAERSIVEPRDPGYERSVVEAEDQLHPHLDASLSPNDNSREVGRVTAQRHEVDDGDRALRRLEVGLEDERMLTIAPRDLRLRGTRRDLPPSMFRPAEERGEARARV